MGKTNKNKNVYILVIIMDVRKSKCKFITGIGLKGMLLHATAANTHCVQDRATYPQWVNEHRNYLDEHYSAIKN